MEWKIAVIALLGVAGIICLLAKRDKIGIGRGIIGILLIAVSILAAVRTGGWNVEGKPVELVKDGIYEIRIVDFSQKDWVGVLVLKEEGKTDLIPPPYKKISTSLFKKDDLTNFRLGEIRTIQKRTVDPPSYQEIIVKQ